MGGNFALLSEVDPPPPPPPQVETIGDAYMVISGAPIETPHHAEYITDFAFSILKATSKINDPSTNKPLRIRIG